MPRPLNLEKLESRMMSATRSKDSIQSLSLWILYHKEHCDEICKQWLNTVDKSDSAHRVTLFYVANDVLQHCKRRNAAEFRVAFAEVLEDAVVMAKNDKTQDEILRIIKIWSERNVYSPDYLAQLTQALNSSNLRESGNVSVESGSQDNEDQMKDDTPEDTRQEVDEAIIIANFKMKNLVTSLQQLVQTRKETEEKQQKLSVHADFSVPRISSLERKSLADKQKAIKRFDTACKVIDSYLSSANEELATMKKTIRLLGNGQVFYTKQNAEVKHVVHAYRIFGKKLKLLQQRLNEKIPTLPENDLSPSEQSTPDESPVVTVEEASPMESDSPDATETTEYASSLNSRLSKLIDVKYISVARDKINVDSVVEHVSDSKKSTEDDDGENSCGILEENSENDLEMTGNETVESIEPANLTHSVENEILSKSDFTISPVSDHDSVELPSDAHCAVEMCDELANKDNQQLPEDEFLLDALDNHTKANKTVVEKDCSSSNIIEPFANTTDAPACSVVDTVKTSHEPVCDVAETKTLDASVCNVAESAKSISTLKLALLKSAKMLSKMMPNANPSNNSQKAKECKPIPFRTLFQVLSSSLNPSPSANIAVAAQLVSEFMHSPKPPIPPHPDDGSVDNLVPMDMDLDSDSDA